VLAGEHIRVQHRLVASLLQHLVHAPTMCDECFLKGESECRACRVVCARCVVCKRRVEGETDGVTTRHLFDELNSKKQYTHTHNNGVATLTAA
jgi:hypothetical protein